MSTEKSQDIVLLRSREVQELIGHVPGGFIRYGKGFILVLLVSALLLCEFVFSTKEECFPLRILPNVSVETVRSPSSGSIVCCNVEQGQIVAAGDTLLVIRTVGKHHILRAGEPGKVNLCSFCITNEPVSKWQSLMEICPEQSISKPFYAIADTLPDEVPLARFQSIEADINGRKMAFRMVRIMENEEMGRKSALFQSETSMEIIREQKTKGRLNTGKAVLYDNLVKMIRDVLHP